MKRKKKTPKQLIIDRLDDLWRDIIHTKKYCEVCGNPKTLNAHHIITRNNKWLRYDIYNGCLLCVSHHKFGNPCAHGNPIWFSEWLKEHRPDDYEYLKDSKWTKTKVWGIADYQEILKLLKARLDEIQECD